MPTSARANTHNGEAEAQLKTRTPLALHSGTGSLDLLVKPNGQVKALSCLFYVATSRAGQGVHVTCNEATLTTFADDGEHIVTYPRPTATGMYFGPRTPAGTIMKGAGHNPSAGITGTATRTVSKGGYVGVLASKFYAGYKRNGEQVIIAWDATTVTINDVNDTLIAKYAKPNDRRGWHGPHQRTPSTKN